MKKKLAVYANGWSNDSFLPGIKGIREYAAKEDFDVFVFMCFASYSENYTLNQGELNIYNLGTMEDYDGVIVFSTMLNSNETAYSLCEKAREKGIPVVSIGMAMDGIPSICIQNEGGMRDLVTHLLEVHGVRRILFMGGTEDHPDSRARLETTRRVMEEHGLTLSEEDVCYGAWGNNGPADIVRRLAASGKPLPDAIVCANDIMALATSTELQELGYSLPEDVIVTGYDHILSGQYAYPALSTVKQNYEQVGYRACEMIYEQMSGTLKETKVLLHSTFVRGESCGCEGELDNVGIRKRYCQNAYHRHLDESMLEQTERVMRNRMSGILSYQVLKRDLQEHFRRNHRYEGGTFSVIVHSDYFEDATASEEELWNSGKKERLEVIVALKNGEILENPSVNRKDLIPGYEKLPGEQHVYYLLPLHHFQFNYGYVVFADEPYLIRADMLYPYMEKLQQSLKLLRINVRLDTLNKNLTRIYDRDHMTGLYNRFVYENKAIPLFEECKKRFSSMVVMFVDINYMKRINDQFGHLHGDNAIKTVADSIKRNIREDWIAVRYGGDEFLIVGPRCNEAEAETVRESILGYLDEKNHDGSQPYQISASCGYVVTDPVSDMALQDYVQEADRMMYEIKKQVHAKDGAAGR
ncbi:MAG: GGDEF domain-containing protein [Lachnospiraceae bacterium]|jgi:diguanylate cyclase (GGDEF)-like protein|nr:GGDEF domain-containing protein [Lachnospiraceae bacterium]